MQEADYLKRPEVKIVIPDLLKLQLVDDWENVTKNNQVKTEPHGSRRSSGADKNVISSSHYRGNPVFGTYWRSIGIMSSPRRSPKTAQREPSDYLLHHLDRSY